MPANEFELTTHARSPGPRQARSTPTAGLDLGGADFGRELVQHAVDELEAIGAAEGLGEFDGLVDDDLVRDLDVVLQLVGADQQDAVLDWRQLPDLAVEEGREAGDSSPTWRSRKGAKRSRSAAASRAAPYSSAL